MLNSRHYGADDLPYSYGDHASQRIFGHGGYRSSTGFADPEYGLVTVLVVNGTPSEEAHQHFLASVIDGVYLDLELG